MINIKTESVAYTADVNYVYDLNELDISSNGNTIKITVSGDVVRIQVGGTNSRTVDVSFEDFYNHMVSI